MGMIFNANAVCVAVCSGLAAASRLRPAILLVGNERIDKIFVPARELDSAWIN